MYGVKLTGACAGYLEYPFLNKDDGQEEKDKGALNLVPRFLSKWEGEPER